MNELHCSNAQRTYRRHRARKRLAVVVRFAYDVFFIVGFATVWVAVYNIGSIIDWVHG